MESVLFIYVFFWVLVWPCQSFVRLWYRVSDVLDLSLVSKRFGFWPHITHVIVLTLKEIKHLSDYRTVGLSDCRIIGRTPKIVTKKSENKPNCVLLGLVYSVSVNFLSWCSTVYRQPIPITLVWQQTPNGTL